ncbi:MAG: SDR family NAD(P)-dependent oxidoreductase [Chloroflexota bacterium]
MRLEDSVIIVTGATAGIGASIARKVAESESKLVITGRREELLKTQSAAYPLPNEQLLIVAGDIRNEEFCQNLIKQTISKFGRVDVMINNAGLGHLGWLTDIPSDDLQQIWETNVYGLAYLSQAVAKVMQTQSVESHTKRRGQIINVSSIVGDRPLMNQGIYTASKAAVNGYSRALRMELAEHDITVSILYPGLTATEFHSVRLGRKAQTRKKNQGVSAELVAEVVLRAIENQKQEIYVTLYDWFFVQANRHFPRLTDYVFQHVANGK